MTTAEARAQVWDPAGFRSRLQSALDVFLAEQGERLAPIGPDALRLHQEACRAVSGGKRFRAAFCYWGFRAVRPTDPEPVHEDWRGNGGMPVNGGMRASETASGLLEDVHLGAAEPESAGP